MVALALVGCGLEPDEVQTNEIEAEASVYQWTDRGTIPNQRSSNQQVGLAYYNGKLHMAHVGTFSSDLYMSSFDGLGWAPAAKITTAGVRASVGPALVAHDGTLKLVFRAAGQNRLMMSTLWNGLTYGPPSTIGSYLGQEQIVGEPTAVSYGGQLYVGYCTRNALRIDRFDGTSWALVKQEQWPSNVTCEQVGLTLVPEFGTLHVVYANATNGQQLMHEQVTWDGGTWHYIHNNNLYGMQASKSLSMVTCNGITHMTHGGAPGSIDHAQVRWAERYNGIWKYDYAVPGQQSWGGMTVGCFGSRAIMVHTGTNTLKWLTFGN